MAVVELTENQFTSDAVQQWMINYLQSEVQLIEDKIDINLEFDELGIDSAKAVKMVGDLEDFLGCELSPSVPFEYSSISKLSTYLASVKSGIK